MCKEHGLEGMGKGCVAKAGHKFEGGKSHQESRQVCCLLPSLLPTVESEQKINHVFVSASQKREGGIRSSRGAEAHSTKRNGQC